MPFFYSYAHTHTTFFFVTNQKVGEVSGVLDTARRLLRGMSRREIQNKVAVGVFAFVMVGIISLLVYYLNFRNN
jgi:hypothetical protein